MNRRQTIVALFAGLFGFLFKRQAKPASKQPVTYGRSIVEKELSRCRAKLEAEKHGIDLDAMPLLLVQGATIPPQMPEGCTGAVFVPEPSPGKLISFARCPEEPTTEYCPRMTGFSVACDAEIATIEDHIENYRQRLYTAVYHHLSWISISEKDPAGMIERLRAVKNPCITTHPNHPVVARFRQAQADWQSANTQQVS